MAELIYDLYPGEMTWELLDGCAIYNSGYGVSGAAGTGELGGFVSNTGKSYLSMGTFNSTTYVIDREAKFFLNLTSMEYMIIDVITGNDSNGGERPNNPGESLYLQSVTGSGTSYLIANSGRDGGYTFPAVDAGGAWTTKTIFISEADKGIKLWRFYANSLAQPEFEGSGGIYASNVNAGDRFGISRIRIYGTVPTHIQYFRGNDKNDEVQIFPGDPLILSWSTQLGSFTGANSVSIDQGIGVVTPTLEGIYTIASGPTQETTYTFTASGNTGNLTKTLVVKMKQPDTDPDIFSFDSIQGANVSTEYTSNTITVGGLGAGISSDLNATNGALTSKNGGAFSTSTKSVTNGDTVTVKMTSSASNNTLKQTSVSVGSATALWKITTKSAAVQVPNGFAFNNVLEAPILSYVESNEITISGLTATVTATSPTNGAESSVNGGAFSTSSKSVSNGDTIKLRLFTSDVLGDTATTSISVGDGPNVEWFVTNVSTADSKPDYFDFTDKSNQAANTYIESNTITVSGINVPTSVSATNGAEFSINGGSWVTTGNILNNQTLTLRILSDSTPGGEVSTDITIGSLTDTWKVTTTTSGDTVPNDFFFITSNNKPPNTYVESNTVLISGITSPATVTVTGGECSINGGSWVTSGTINNQDTLKLRVLTSNSLNTPVTASVTIG
jgi:hypothetical protein